MKIIIDIPEEGSALRRPFFNYNDPCANCQNNPAVNPNASGICNCALPYTHGKQKITCSTTAEYPYLGTSWTYSTTAMPTVTLRG